MPGLQPQRIKRSPCDARTQTSHRATDSSRERSGSDSGLGWAQLETHERLERVVSIDGRDDIEALLLKKLEVAYQAKVLTSDRFHMGIVTRP